MAKQNPSKYFDKKRPAYTPTIPALKATLEEVLAKLRGRGNLKFLDQKTMSQEALVNASWLWMRHVIETDGVATLERHLQPAFDRLSIMVAEDRRRRGEA
jgi:hypothetical protein